MSESISGMINNLSKMRDVVDKLAIELGKAADALSDIVNELNKLRNEIDKLDISDIGKEQLLKALEQCIKMLDGYVRDAVVRKLNLTLSELTKG